MAKEFDPDLVVAMRHRGLRGCRLADDMFIQRTEPTLETIHLEIPPGRTVKCESEWPEPADKLMHG